jgi:hypothetical protein
MSLGHGASIVRDGLVLHLDAANSKSYPGSGTVWSDLSGNGNHGTLVNGVGYSANNKGSLSFDGVDDYVSISGSRTLTAATFLIWLKRSGPQGSFDGIFFSRAVGNTTGLNYHALTNNLGYHWNGIASSYNYNSGLLVPDSSWCMCALTVSPSSAVFYLYTSLGLFMSTNSISHLSTTLGGLEIGRDSTLNRFMSGNVSITALYNRALTPEEIRQNFESMRGRYGI